MNRRTLGMVAALAATVLGAGCRNADDEFAPAVVPKTYAFEGKVDAKYVGTWSSGDGNSVIDLLKDGTLKIATTTRSMAGKNTSHVNGQWLAQGDALMMHYTVGTQAPTVLKYSATLSDGALSLTPDGSRTKTVYHHK